MAREGNINFYIDSFHLLNWFPGKPDPTIYLLAAKHINLDPKDCVVVEDSPPME